MATGHAAFTQTSLPYVEIGVIGGTGVYGVEGLTDKKEYVIDTPFGRPSCPIIVGKLDGVPVAFVASFNLWIFRPYNYLRRISTLVADLLLRHDVGHRLLPTEIPFRANLLPVHWQNLTREIYALKMLGVKYLLTFGACGSLQEKVAPRHVVLVDQFVDRTKTRPDTFFGNGVIAHVALGDPTCPIFREIVKEALLSLPDPPVVHTEGIYVCIEGPAFSTRAESVQQQFPLHWGCTVIGMTAVPEFKLAREAEMAYCQVALVTDYDCWHPDHDNVTVEMVVKNLKANGETAQKCVREVVKRLAEKKFTSAAHNALQFSILTPKDQISQENRERLKFLIGKYL